MNTSGKERVIAYVDGFNLYNGLKDSGFKRYCWLNLETLVLKFLKPQQELIGIKYFSSSITSNVDKRALQKIYFDALSTAERVRTVLGEFQPGKNQCHICGQFSHVYNEKMTDVNIATHMLADFYGDRFDVAMLISGDTDLVPPIRHINESGTSKLVFVAFPPGRVNDKIRKYAKGSLVIGRKNLADSQFEEKFQTAYGEILSRPTKWR